MNDQVERVAVPCPRCQAVLNVRRSYIGRQVLCNHCEQTILLSAPARREVESTERKTQSVTVAAPPQRTEGHNRSGIVAELQRRRANYDRLRGENERLQVAYNLLEAAHDRLQAEFDRVGEKLRRVAGELETIRVVLGTTSPHEVRSLAAERDSLRAEVDRLGNELDALRGFESEGGHPFDMARTQESREPVLQSGRN
jgi:chromosome segregation ATPase